MSASPSALLDLRGLRVELASNKQNITLISHCDLSVGRGEVVGLVGESGSGKTMLGLTVMGLLPPSAKITADKMSFAEIDLLTATAEQRRALRGRRIAMVFQDPMAALNPYLRISSQLREMLPAGTAKSDTTRLVLEALASVGLADPARCADAYPHELSGGMRQRALLAMMLLGEPELLIADEPTTALDVTVQAQVLRLLGELVRSRGLSMLLVSHDLGVVASVADRIAVMYAGEIVESGRCQQVLCTPAHPYTAALLASRPSAQRLGQRLQAIDGHVPAAGSMTGCVFAPRCRHCKPQCLDAEVRVTSAGHGGAVRCVRQSHDDLPPLATAWQTP